MHSDRHAQAVARILEQYDQQKDRYQKLLDYISTRCRHIIAESRIPATVQSRLKSPDSLRRKLMQDKYRSALEATLSTDPSTGLKLIEDLAGIRIVTYVEPDRARIVEKIRERFSGPDGNPNPRIEARNNNGYLATHCQVCITQNEIVANARLDNLRNDSAEIQVSSMMAHVWNEVEHDLRYKPDVDWMDEASTRDLRLDELHRLTRNGDKLINGLLIMRSQIIAESLRSTVSDCTDTQYPLPGDRLPQALSLAVRLGYEEAETIIGLIRGHQSSALELWNELVTSVDSDDEIGGATPTVGKILLCTLILLHGETISDYALPDTYSHEANLATLANQLIRGRSFNVEQEASGGST